MLAKSSNVLHFMRLGCQCENPVYAGEHEKSRSKLKH